MTLMEAIEARRSIRAFRPDPIPDEALEAILRAAQLSPSGGNGQAYRFGLVFDKALKQELAEAAGNQLWIAQAPIVIACCAMLDVDFKDVPPDDFGLQVNYLRFGKPFMDYLGEYPDRRAVMTLFENSTPIIPAEHMMLAAVTYGLGTCMIGYLDVARANRALNLPPDKTCLFLLPVGYPGEIPREQHRKPLEELVFINRHT